MRKAILTVTLGLCSLPIMAQKAQQAFRGYLYNNEYDVYLDIDFHHESITVPGNELYGHGRRGSQPAVLRVAFRLGNQSQNSITRKGCS